MRAGIPSLLLITDSRRYSDDHLFTVLDRVLGKGVDAILLREKELSSAKLLALAAKLRELTTARGAALYIHTQADIASAVNADGVHVASGDIMNIPAIRSWLNDADKTVSASCHTKQELGLAEQYGADFVFLSPVFPTQSHPGAASLGVDQFNSLSSQTPLPVIALGGIDSDNCTAFKEHGIAVISAILGAEDPGMAVNQLSKSGSQ